MCVLRHVISEGELFSLFASDGVNVRFGTSSRTHIRLLHHLAPNPRKLLPPHQQAVVCNVPPPLPRT